MIRRLQHHKEPVLRIIRSHPEGIFFSRLQSKAGLITEALERVLGQLRKEGLVTVYRERFFDAKAFNRRIANAESDKAVGSATKDSGTAGKKAKAAKPAAVEVTLTGGVEMLDYKLRLLGALVEKFEKDKPAVANDLKHIRSDLKRLARINEHNTKVMKGAS